MSVERHLRRTDLLLVRVWTEEAIDGTGMVEWRGKVQRVVNGEAHQVNSWQALMDTLRTMLSADGTAGSAGNTSSYPQPPIVEHTDVKAANI